MGAGTEEIFVISNFKMLPPAFNRKKILNAFLFRQLILLAKFNNWLVPNAMVKKLGPFQENLRHGWSLPKPRSL